MYYLQIICNSEIPMQRMGQELISLKLRLNHVVKLTEICSELGSTAPMTRPSPRSARWPPGVAITASWRTSPAARGASSAATKVSVEQFVLSTV